MFNKFLFLLRLLMDYDSPSQQIDSEIVKTHFPRDFNDKIISFVGYLKHENFWTFLAKY